MEIDSVLHKNRIIAEKIANSESQEISHTDLMKKGYNMTYFTHLAHANSIYESEKMEYKCIYQFVIIPLNTNPLTFKFEHNE